MSARGLIVHTSGSILRTVTCSPTMMPAHVQSEDESLFALLDDTGQAIDDSKLKVSEVGSFEPLEEDGPAVPAGISLGYVYVER